MLIMFKLKIVKIFLQFKKSILKEFRLYTIENSTVKESNRYWFSK